MNETPPSWKIAAFAPLQDKGFAMQNRMMRLPEVMKITAQGRSTIYAKMARGEFPAPVKLGARAVAWPETAIAEWIANRPSARTV